MNGLNVEKKSEGLRYFILITIIPILGIIIIFSYAFFHVQNDVDFISHEIKGIKVITLIQKTVFNIQKLRGLTCIENPDIKSIDEIEALKKSIFDDLKNIKQHLQLIENGSSLRNELLKFIDSINENSQELENSTFVNLSKIIDGFTVLSNRISYHSKLILDPDLNSYILIKNVVYLLPELIEENGQIRAVASRINDNAPTSTQKRHIVIQLYKIKERLNKLDYNMLLLYETPENNKLRTFHNKMIKAQNYITEFAEDKLLQNQKITLGANGIFSMTTNNIDLIIALYTQSLDVLNSNLEKRLKIYKRLLVYIILSALASILFIVYVNRIFYNKNKEFIEKIEELTITDGMTSLYNRRYFDEVFNNYVKIQQRTKQTLVFIILDIDFFKQYNDTYGHQAGDLVIKTVAKNLKNSLKRASDMAFRLGGEEFGILCAEPDDSQALSFANNIRKKIENEKIEHKMSRTSEYVTISMGLIVIRPEYINNTSDINNIYKCADEALYKAKENGRNMVIVYEKCNINEVKS